MRIRLAIAGAAGRTGRHVVERAGADERFELVAALTAPGGAEPGASLRAGDREVVLTESLDAPCDVLIDFSVADGTIAWLSECRKRGIAMVIGATGHSEDQLRRIAEAAHVIPILIAGNFSTGLQAVLRMVGQVARELGDSYDIEIVESHHRHKVDAPSGTALSLVDAIQAARGRPNRTDVVFGRSGRTGPRPSGQIGVHAMRMGDVVGSHAIHFSGPGETVTIHHEVHSRETFAVGALRAAAWLSGRPAGRYTLLDISDGTT